MYKNEKRVGLMDIITVALTSIIFKKPININKVDTQKIVLFDKTPNGEEGANKYYIGYVRSTGFRPLHIIIKNTRLYTNHMNVLANDNESLKYIKIWSKIKALLKKTLYNRPVYNKYIKLSWK